MSIEGDLVEALRPLVRRLVNDALADAGKQVDLYTSKGRRRPVAPVDGYGTTRRTSPALCVLEDREAAASSGRSRGEITSGGS